MPVWTRHLLNRSRTAQPVCQTCTSQERACSYDEQPKKRGIQPNYIRTLELTLSWLFRTIPESERVLASSLAASGIATRQLISGKDGQSDALHQGWRNGVICKQIDQLLSGAIVELPATLQPAGTYQFTPLSAPSEQTLLAADISPAIDAPEAKEMTRGSHLREQSQRQAPELHPDALAHKSMPLPPRAWTLVEYYFAFTHAWLPMIDRQAILKLMYTYPGNGVLRSDTMNGEYAELWSILALASAQIPDEELKSESDHYCDLARSLIPSERITYELGHVKAMILLAVLEVSRERWMAAWVHIGVAIRVIVVLASARMALGLGSQADLGQWTSGMGPHPALSFVEVKTAQCERFKHIALSAFVLESAIASRMGAYPHLSPRQVSKIGLVDEDGLEEWSPWHDPLSSGLLTDMKAPARSFSTLNHLVRLTLRNEATEWTTSGRPFSTLLSNLVIRLIHNAGEAVNRIQPAAMVSTYGNVTQDHTVEHHSMRTLPDGGMNVHSMQWEDPNPMEQNLSPQDLRHSIHQQLPYMSRPVTMDHAFSGSPAVSGSANMNTGLWVGNNTAIDRQLDMGNETTFASADLFEELAMLERTQSGQNPQFMQNLGFASNLDLDDFLGSDY